MFLQTIQRGNIMSTKATDVLAFNAHLSNLQALRSRLLKNIDRVRTNLNSLEQQLAGTDALISAETQKELNRK